MCYVALEPRFFKTQNKDVAWELYFDFYVEFAFGSRKANILELC